MHNVTLTNGTTIYQLSPSRNDSSCSIHDMLIMTSGPIQTILKYSEFDSIEDDKYSTPWLSKNNGNVHNPFFAFHNTLEEALKEAKRYTKNYVCVRSINIAREEEVREAARLERKEARRLRRLNK